MVINTSVFFAVLFFGTLFLWIGVMVLERRTIYSGFLLLLSSAFLGAFLLSLAMKYPAWFSAHLLAHILLDAELIFLGLLFVGYPLVLTPVLMIGGAILMKREGVRFQNLLALILAFLLLAFDAAYPLFFPLSGRGFFTYLYWYLTLVSLYFVMQTASFALSALLNLIHVRKDHGLAYVVVLGGRVRGYELTPLLRNRVERGIRVYRENPGSKLIFSGGQGEDEPMPESRAMAEFAIKAGVPEEDIIEEDRSRNTEENIRFSAELMEPGAFFGIATSSYHVMRSLLIARRQKLRCIGFGAKTRAYYAINAFLREYAGYFRDTRRVRLVHLALLTLVYLIFCLRTGWRPAAV